MYRPQHAGVVRNVRIDQHQGSEQQRRAAGSSQNRCQFRHCLALKGNAVSNAKHLAPEDGAAGINFDAGCRTEDFEPLLDVLADALAGAWLVRY